MPYPPSSKYKLKKDPPTGFNEAQKKFTRVELMYKVVGPNVYEFFYRSASVPFAEAESLVRRLSDRDWILFFRASEASSLAQRQDDQSLNVLDLRVEGKDTEIEVVTSPGLYWSRQHHAIQTKISREDFYGYLRYNDNGTWKYFDDYMTPQTLSRVVRFKAKLNPDYGNRNHKFSYFVLLTKPDDSLLEYEIDPDIKNPSS